MWTSKSLLCSLAVTALLSGQSAEAHTWLEHIQVVSGALFKAGAPLGYIRNYVGRQSTTVDVSTTNLIGSLTTGVNICKSNEQSPGQQSGLPQLSAYANDLVLGTYLENGHIWKELLHVDPTGSKSGTIYWYGTQNAVSNRTVDSVLEWTMDGSGGDGQGELLGSTDFDDGTCIEVGQEAATGRVGGPCKSYFRLPKTAEAGKDYTVYWLWDYSEHFGPDPNHIEWYSCCMDINILAPATTKARRTRRSVKDWA